MKLIGKALIAGVSVCMFVPLLANAGLMHAEFDGNDCPNYFGTDGFESCVISIGDNVLSPVIVKYDYENQGNDNDINETEFGSVAYDDFTVSWGDGLSGRWDNSGSYDASVDPGVRYWSAKAGNYFKLFWMVADEDEGDCGDAWSFDCLKLAQVVSGGEWDTSGLGNGRHDISHLTLYNSHPSNVPEPGALMLLGLGLLGLGAARRKAKRG